MNLAAVLPTHDVNGAREAVYAAEQAVKHAPKAADAWRVLGRMAWSRSVAPAEQVRRAVEAFEQAIRLSPTDESLWQELKLTLESAKNPQLASAVRRRLQPVNPRAVRALEQPPAR